MALREVALRLGATLEPLVVEQVHGRFAMRRNAKGGGVSLRGFEFTRQLDHFVDCICGRQQCGIASFAQGLETDSVIAQIRRDAPNAARN